MTIRSFANSVIAYCDWIAGGLCRQLGRLGFPAAGRFGKPSYVVSFLAFWWPCGAVVADDSAAYSIACRLVIERAPSLTPRLAEAVREQIRGVYQAVLGDEGTFRFLDAEAAVPLPLESLHA